MAKRSRAQGAEAFESYYASLFGARWQPLREALLREPRPVPFCPCGTGTYYLDSASLYAAACLPMAGAGRILDMCAAPGGKTLVLARRMDSGARLFANERSPDRKARLAKVCTEHLSEDVRSHVQLSCSDAATWCTRPNEPFDAILLDAPCSSERHVLADPRYLAQWTPGRIRSLAVAQWALLSCGWRLLAEGGFLLYATCALAPAENDGVLRRLLARFPDARCLASVQPDAEFAARFLPAPLPLPERTEHGFCFLPDTAGGAGPLCFSLIQKKSAQNG